MDWGIHWATDPWGSKGNPSTPFSSKGLLLVRDIHRQLQREAGPLSMLQLRRMTVPFDLCQTGFLPTLLSLGFSSRVLPSCHVNVLLPRNPLMLEGHRATPAASEPVLSFPSQLHSGWPCRGCLFSPCPASHLTPVGLSRSREWRLYTPESSLTPRCLVSSRSLACGCFHSSLTRGLQPWLHLGPVGASKSVLCTTPTPVSVSRLSADLYAFTTGK